MPSFYRYLFALCLFALPPSLAAQSTNLLISPDTPFLFIDFPKEAELQLDSLYLGDQLVLVHRHSLNTASEGNAAYLLNTTVSEYPPEYIHSDSSFQLIEGFINSAISPDVESGVAELLSSTYVFKNGFFGKTFRLKGSSDGGQIVRHLYLVENYLIEIEVSSLDWFGITGTSFLGSFYIEKTKVNDVDYGFEIIAKASFFVEFPGTPEVRQSFIATEIGIISSRVELLERNPKIGNILFTAQEAAYPASMFTEDFSLQKFYDESIKGLLKSSNATLVNRKAVTVLDQEGYQIQVSMFAGKMSGYYRAVLLEERLYMTCVFSASNVINEEIENFFDSFQLMD
jgi:hypothetical protein